VRGGGVGWGLPATIGAKLALPEPRGRHHRRRQRALYDAGAGTAARYSIGAIFVILNIRPIAFSSSACTPWGISHRSTNMSAWSSSIGGRFLSLSRVRREGRACQTVHEATDLLAQAIKDGGPMLIDVTLDRSFKPM
jgi:benzoylformate decarboxylase